MSTMKVYSCYAFTIRKGVHLLLYQAACQVPTYLVSQIRVTSLNDGMYFSQDITQRQAFSKFQILYICGTHV